MPLDPTATAAAVVSGSLIRGSLSQDVKRLLQAFRQKGSLHMADFREAWRELDFTAIFAAMTEAHSRVQFMEELYGAVLDFLMVGVHFELRVGILYTLYMLYSAQPEAHERVRIKVTQDAWEALIETERTATVQQLWDAVYVARQLRARNAYLHCAHMPLPALRLIPQVTNPELVREARVAEHATEIRSTLIRGKLGGLSDPLQIGYLSELARASAEAKERMDAMVAATGLGSQPSSQQPTVGLIKPPPRSGSSTPVSQRPATAAERAAFPSTLYELVQPHLDAKLDRLAQPELDLRELQRQLDERQQIAPRGRPGNQRRSVVSDGDGAAGPEGAPPSPAPRRRGSTAAKSPKRRSSTTDKPAKRRRSAAGLPGHSADDDGLGDDATATATGRGRGRDRGRGQGRGRGGGRGRGRGPSHDGDDASPERSPSATAATAAAAAEAPARRGRGRGRGGARGSRGQGRGRERGRAGSRAPAKGDRPESDAESDDESSAAADSPEQSGSDEAEAESEGDDIVCTVCSDGRYTDENQIVLCDDCNRAYHQRCHRPVIKPEYIEDEDRPWYCAQCTVSRKMARHIARNPLA